MKWGILANFITKRFYLTQLNPCEINRGYSGEGPSLHCFPWGALNRNARLTIVMGIGQLNDEFSSIHSVVEEKSKSNANWIFVLNLSN